MTSPYLAREAARLGIPYPAGHRIEPTAEDMAIFQRSVSRLIGWARAERARRRYVAPAELCNVMRRAMLDVMHFGPAT